MTVGRWLFLRVIGLTYTVAFVSFGVQADGLIGDHGISPLPRFLDAVRQQVLDDRILHFPTLFWLNSSEAFVRVLWMTGAGAGLVAAIGVLQAPALAWCWISYLSLQVAGQQFMGFQWDILLLETGFIAIWWAPVSVVPRPLAGGWSDRLGRWLVLWLLFRLMFASGMVKLLSGDANWRGLTALTVHYETQPLPTWIGWWAHQLPRWMQTISCAVMFAIELGAPWAVFIPFAPVRRAGAGAIILLMVLIALTGNYCFFNLLAVALCLPLIDDARWPGFVRRAAAGGEGPRARNWPVALVAPVTALLFLASAVLFTSQMRLTRSWPGPAVSLYRTAANLRIVNGYGLFAVMTTERNEIIVEGSADGRTWKPYGFRWKPGGPGHRPAFVAPHQPRLDWQMWFAALGTAQDNPWFVSMCIRLLEGESSVLRLLGANPFPAAPPRFVRARLERYRFTRLGTDLRESWWTVSPAADYLEPISLRGATGSGSR